VNYIIYKIIFVFPLQYRGTGCLKKLIRRALQNIFNFLYNNFPIQKTFIPYRKRDMCAVVGEVAMTDVGKEVYSALWRDIGLSALMCIGFTITIVTIIAPPLSQATASNHPNVFAFTSYQKDERAKPGSLLTKRCCFSFSEI
jgi:hypothetical protein